MVRELLPAPHHQLPHQHGAGEVPAQQGGACPPLVGLVGLLDGQGLIRNVQRQQLVQKHAKGEQVHLLVINLPHTQIRELAPFKCELWTPLYFNAHAYV